MESSKHGWTLMLIITVVVDYVDLVRVIDCVMIQ